MIFRSRYEIMIATVISLRCLGCLLSGGSAPWVEFLVGAFEAVAVHMGVNLGGGDVGMAQHHLHGAEIRAMFQQVGGKGVAEHMGADFFVDSLPACALLDDLPETQAGHGFAVAGDKKEIARSFSENPGAGVFAVDLEVFAGRLAKG